MPKPVKLLRRDVLSSLHAEKDKGVPVYKLCEILKKEHDISMSAPTLGKLIQAYYRIGDDDKVEQSLFPSWVKDKIQTQDPTEWAYKGLFPWGVWQQYDIDVKRPDKYK